MKTRDMKAREAARQSGAVHYFTGIPCVRGHVSRRWTKRGTCVQCWQERSEEEKKKAAAYRVKLLSDPHEAEKQRQRIRNHYKRNKESRVKQIQAWRADNMDKVRKCGRAYFKRHPERCYAKAALYRARKHKAMPPWADPKEIALVYKKARELTKQTGIKHDVDHIIPLKGRNVCGLHTADNLQAIPSAVNYRKYNTFKDF